MRASPYLVLSLAVVFVSFGAILVRLADAPALAVSFYRVALAPCVALLGSRAEKAHLVFAQTEGLPHDVPALLREAVGHLGGRGGGRGDLAQGGGDRPGLLDEALDRAAEKVRTRS